MKQACNGRMSHCRLAHLLARIPSNFSYFPSTLSTAMVYTSFICHPLALEEAPYVTWCGKRTSTRAMILVPLFKKERKKSMAKGCFHPHNFHPFGCIAHGPSLTILYSMITPHTERYCSMGCRRGTTSRHDMGWTPARPGANHRHGMRTRR